MERVTKKEQEPKAESNDSGAYAVFRPFTYSLFGTKVYKSEEEMLKKLSKEFGVKAEIDKNGEFRSSEFGWEHEQFIKFLNKRGNDCIIGYCDCNTFKKG